MHTKKSGTNDNTKNVSQLLEMTRQHQDFGVVDSKAADSIHFNTEVSEPWISKHEGIFLSSIVLLFFLIVMCLATYLIKIGRQPDLILKMFGTILIICIAAFLIVAGYDDKQIAPVIGLLGTIAGYLLGSHSKDEKKTEPKS